MALLVVVVAAAMEELPIPLLSLHTVLLLLVEGVPAAIPATALPMGQAVAAVEVTVPLVSPPFFACHRWHSCAAGAGEAVEFVSCSQDPRGCGRVYA